MFKKLFQKNKPSTTFLAKQERDPARYESEREAARSKSIKDRLKVAQSPQTHLEILYYLADDQDKKVRRAVAANPATPVHVSESLARDSDTDVKLALVKRLVELLPDLSHDQYAHLYAFSVQALGVLALDEVLKVRLALASALRDKAYAPPEVVNQLARDLERKVSEPILKLCTAVSDEVLLDIIVQHPEDWVIESIAARPELSVDVSGAIVKTKSISGGKILIENDKAKIDDETLDMIIEQARETPEWHKLLAINTHLPSFVITRIIDFVDKSIHKIIFNRNDLDRDLRRDLKETVARRIGFMLGKNGDRLSPDQKVNGLIEADAMNDTAICDALALREYEVVYLALSQASELSLPVTRKMIDTSSPKAVTALAWKAGFEMRTALEIQKTMAKIHPRDLIYPRNGNQFPLKDVDMKWQINFFND
jgi:uncharacterized protein (DUF2336 family)